MSPALKAPGVGSAAKSEVAAFLDGFLRDPTFLARYPYYVAILARLTPVADPSVHRMAVSLHLNRFYLHINVDAFVAEPQYLRGVLLHEVHHVVLGHLSHPKFATVAEPDLLDLALEMSANEYIEEPLPNPILWKAYAAIGMRAGQSTLERYHKLAFAQQDGASAARPAKGGGEERADDHRFLRQGQGDAGSAEKVRQILREAVEEAGETKGGNPDRFLLAGKTPGRLLEELSGVAGPAECFLDWKTALRMFVARARGPVHTYARPNRRFPGRIGEVPGRTYAPHLLTRPSLLVAIDTSMSMSRPEIEEVGRQLAALAEHARLLVAECDTEITRVYAFEGRLDDIEGRGGTDLQPVFDPLFLAAHGVSGVVYFTDGEGPFPDRPPAIQVLWVLTKPLTFACPWGQRAVLTRKHR